MGAALGRREGLSVVIVVGSRLQNPPRVHHSGYASGAGRMSVGSDAAHVPVPRRNKDNFAKNGGQRVHGVERYASTIEL